MAHIDARKVEADFSFPVVLVSAADGPRRNCMAATQVVLLSYDPLLIAVAVSPSHYTYELIAASGEFSVAVAGRDQADLVRNVGRSKGRDVDKFGHFGIATRKATVIDAPLIEGCLAALECTVHQIVPTGDHRLVIGHVLAHHHFADGTPLVLFEGKLQ